MAPFFSVFLLFLLLLPTPFKDDGLTASPDIPESILPLVTYIESRGYDIKSLMQDPRFELYDGIADRFRNAAEVRIDNIEDYKRRINYEGKKRGIVPFMNTYAEALAKAEKEYGIPANVIAAIIGIESDFGRVTGRYNPFNVYVSMFNEGYRAPFAQAQLEELLRFVRNNNIDVFELNSSYAGAMGFAQFIPYSLNRWFVGSDLFYMENNIYSVANYLAHFKQRTGSVERAVFRYNPSRLYTEAVMSLAAEVSAL